jgi:hypothetical protein
MLLVGGEVVVEDDALPGMDMAKLASDARQAMRMLMV